VDLEGTGARVRRLRNVRGVTQHQLAARAHFSLSLVRKVEQGVVPPSAAFVARAAQALGVKPSYLYGTDERDLAEQPTADAAGMAELRVALDAYDDPRPVGRQSLSTLDRRLREIAHQVYGLRYAEAAGELPDVLQHLYVLADQPGHAGEQARAHLHDAYRMAATLAGRFRQADLAAIASERHVRIAPLTGDPLRIAISAYHRSTRHLQHGEYRTGLRILDRARDHITATPFGRAIGVQLDLRSAVLAARAGGASAADGYLEHARAQVDQFAPPAQPYYNIDASPVNVTIHWCAAPVENYDGAEAVRRSQQVNVVDPDRPERVAHHHIDMARAWMLHGNREQTLANLNAARRMAPFNTRNHPSVHETVLALAGGDRRATDSLSAFARWAGVDL
jgi:transcriptional regulator with XRE-family HTH domain